MGTTILTAQSIYVVIRMSTKQGCLVNSDRLSGRILPHERKGDMTKAAK